MRTLWKGLTVGGFVGAAVDNSWKGLIVGGVIGGATGSALEVLNRGADTASEVKKQADERAGDALDWVRDVTERASGWLREAEVPERARELAQRVVDSDVASRVKTMAGEVAEGVKERVPHTE